MKRLFAIAAVAFVTLLWVIITDPFDKHPTSGADDMSQNIVQPNPELADSAPFPSDISAVETAWDMPIPTNHIVIGGVDGFGWLHVMQTQDQGIFMGSYLDATQYYQGLMRVLHPNGKAVPADLFQSHYVSHFEAGSGALMYPFDAGAPPVEYILLSLMEPEKLRTK